MVSLPMVSCAVPPRSSAQAGFGRRCSSGHASPPRGSQVPFGGVRRASRAPDRALWTCPFFGR
eukprot:8011617-Pyramimonas_sp.AAC.1